MKKILITGSSGYIGPYLCVMLRKLPALSETELKITTVYNNHPVEMPGITSVKCDLMNSDELTDVFRQTDPDTVFHLASGTPMRIIGKEDEYITKFNVDVTAQIAKLCSANNSLLIYTSTDLVYKDGIDLKENESTLNPLTIYAKTKLLGEQAIIKTAPHYLIFRTALVYGFTLSTYTSFYDIAFAALSRNEKVFAFTDQFRNPIYVEDAAEILSIAPSLYEKNDIINFCGSEYLSRYQMCEKMCDEFGFDKTLVIPASCDEFNKYPMVKNLGLNNEKLVSLGLRTNSFADNLKSSKVYMP